MPKKKQKVYKFYDPNGECVLEISNPVAIESLHKLVAFYRRSHPDATIPEALAGACEALSRATGRTFPTKH
jgi:hypothetical protein